MNSAKTGERDGIAYPSILIMSHVDFGPLTHKSHTPENGRVTELSFRFKNREILVKGKSFCRVFWM